MQLYTKHHENIFVNKDKSKNQESFHPWVAKINYPYTAIKFIINNK